MSRKAVLAIVDDVVDTVIRELPRVIEEIEEPLCKKLEKLRAIQEYSIRKSEDFSAAR